MLKKQIKKWVGRIQEKVVSIGLFVRFGGQANPVTVENAENGTVVIDGGDRIRAGSTVKVFAKPADGYLLVPGEFCYVTADGRRTQIIRKATEAGAFGGDGQHFQFCMPPQAVTVSARFESAEQTDFQFNVLGASVRRRKRVYDGIRFLARLNLGVYDPMNCAISVLYKGNSYRVVQVGMLLKRADNPHPLTLDTYQDKMLNRGKTQVWRAVAYDRSGAHATRLIDYTDSYMDIQVSMVKGTRTTVQDFYNRKFVACGYLQLSDRQETIIVYTDLSDEASIQDVLEKQKQTLL